MDETQGQTTITQTEAGVATQTPPPVMPQVQFTLPRGGELIKWAWQFYRAHVRVLFGITVIPFVCSIAALISMKVFPQPVAIGLSFVSAIVGYIASFAVLAAIAADGGSVAAAYRRAGALFFAALWVMALSGAATFGGFTLLIVPGIIVSLYLTFALYILFAEEVRGLNALTKSWHYASGLLGQILWRSLFLAFVLLLTYVVVAILIAIAHAIEGVSNPTEQSILGGSLQALFQVMIAGPLSSIYMYGMYRSIRDAKQATPATAQEEGAARRRITLFAILGVVVFVLLIVAAVVFLGMMWSAQSFMGNAVPMPQPTAPSSGASAMIGLLSGLGN